MNLTDWWSRVRTAIANCSSCNDLVSSKPFIEYKVYENYAPSELRVLIVSESPPPGNTQSFLYNTSSFDRLRRLLSRIFGVPENKVLDWLKSRNCFWSMAIKCRPKDKRYVRRMWLNCLPILRLEISARPQVVIALGRIAQRAVKTALANSDYEGITIHENYHPLYVQRFMRDYLDDYASWLRGVIGN